MLDKVQTSFEKKKDTAQKEKSPNRYVSSFQENRKKFQQSLNNFDSSFNTSKIVQKDNKTNIPRKTVGIDGR